MRCRYYKALNFVVSPKFCYFLSKHKVFPQPVLKTFRLETGKTLLSSVMHKVTRDVS